MAALLGAAGRCVAQTVVYNLANDWSDVNNPNGVWRLNKAPGQLFTTNQADYWADAAGQHAWAEQAFAGNAHVPVWMKLTEPTPAASPSIGTFATVGTVIVHTAETGRTGTEFTSVTWTSPAGGTAFIAGGAWVLKTIDRPQRWELLINGVSLTQGDLSVGDSYTQSTPFNFTNGSSGASVMNPSVQTNDVIELRIYRQSTATPGYLVGLNFSVSLTSIPEPAATALIAGGLALCGMLGVRVRLRRG